MITHRVVNLDDYAWFILPGRNVAHAFDKNSSVGLCGMTKAYPRKFLVAPTPSTRRCEACLILLASGISSNDYKFFLDFVPNNVRQQRRSAWKSFLREHPEYGPPSWRDRTIGSGK